MSSHCVPYDQSLVGKGLKAGEWVNEVSALLSAKGGGRDESAQCSGSGTDKVTNKLCLIRTQCLLRFW